MKVFLMIGLLILSIHLVFKEGDDGKNDRFYVNARSECFSLHLRS